VSASERATGGTERRYYEIRVRGPMGATVMQAFPALTATPSGDDTLLTGPLPDPSALYGVINQLEALGLHLLEIRRLRSGGAGARANHLTMPCGGAVSSDFLSSGAMTPDRLRQAAMALAVGRAAMGVTALAAPSLIWRPWVGDARGVPVRVLGRALGGRDLALGLGTLAALRAVPPAGGAAGTAGAWVAFAALADSLDLVTTAVAWEKLPAVGRWMFATTAGGAAVVGTVAAWSLSTSAADDRA
jgi:hypothetical protein